MSLLTFDVGTSVDNCVDQIMDNDANQNDDIETDFDNLDKHNISLIDAKKDEEFGQGNSNGCYFNVYRPC